MGDDEKLSSLRLVISAKSVGVGFRVAGKCHGILSFLVAPCIFTTHLLSAQLTGTNPDQTSNFLIKVKETFCRQQELPGSSADRLQDVTVMPTQEYSSISMDFWMKRTGIGLSFGAATMMGLLVGLVMVAQTLYAMVLDRISEYATLKAIGSNEKEIILLLGAQATFVAIVGILIGTMISFLI